MSSPSPTLSFPGCLLRAGVRFLLAAGIALGCLPHARAATRTQTLGLAYGWNAVWLKVSPVDANGSPLRAEEVFTSPDFIVDRLATQAAQSGTAEFSTDPSQLFNQPGWLVWVANAPSGQSGAILAAGHRAYLVHVSRKDGTVNDGPPAGVLKVTGQVSFWEPTWKKGSYNLTGFSVSGSPTFRALLAASGIEGAITPAGSSIQRLNPATGNWEGFSPDEFIEPGRAYWMHVLGSITSVSYYGPVRSAFPGSQLGGLAFGEAPATVAVPYSSGGTSTVLHLSPTELTFTSLEAAGGASHAVTLSQLAPDPGGPGGQDLRLFPLERVPDQLAWQIQGGAPVTTNWGVGTLGPQESRTVTLGLDRNWSSSGNYRENLYRLDVALAGGTYYQYLPVSARNEDLAPPNPNPDTNAPPAPPGPGLAGLWIGTVAANAVTSLTEGSHPVRPASTSAPLRLLIHVGTNGQATLLANVTRMQTKTADPSVPPREVLILDEARIPFYEGLQDRGGRKVGIRYETAFFDMPRLYTAGAQDTNFLQRVAGPTKPVDQVTDQDVQDYLATQGTRPKDLQEVYALQFPLLGAFLPGQSIGTATNAPLRLDAFHRSNPFRHAFHPQHGAGYTIERNLTLALEDYRSGSGILTGTYQEVTTGLATAPIISRGRLTLQRVSTTTTLE
ncbi:MAG: hypothetical protein ACKO3N_19870 [Verrucomicrobiota bacterium]